MSYTGAWLRNAYTDPAAATLHTADPAHAETGEDDDPGRFAYEAPPLTPVGVGPGGEYPGSEWVVTTPGTVIDNTDYSTHEASTADVGAARQGYYAVPPTTFHDEHYTGAQFAGLPGQTVNPTALQRGLNSLGQNNPEGFEPGRVMQNWVERDFAIGERVHDARVVTPNTAFEEGNVPPQGTPYSSPFDSLARAMTRGYQTPAMRRAPEQYGEDLITDDPGPNPDMPVWVVG